MDCSEVIVESTSERCDKSWKGAHEIEGSAILRSL